MIHEQCHIKFIFYFKIKNINNELNLPFNFNKYSIMMYQLCFIKQNVLIKCKKKIKLFKHT